jgi:GxxExxY protein
LKCAYRLDLFVEDRVVVEIKVVEHIPPVATSQLLTLLRLLNCRVGLLINFHEPILRNGIRRVVNGW